jgi:tyrosinase
MSVEEIAKLKNAYKSLQDETDDGYELIAGIHGLPEPISCPHHLPTHAFLPWHRKYLLAFEELLRRYEPDVMLPYWDWATT